MSDAYPTAALADVCEPQTIRDPSIQPDAPFIYVDISSVDNDAKRIVQPKRILGADAPSRARKEIRAGDIIVSTTRPNLNAVAVVPEELNEQICSTGFCVLRPRRELIDPKYLFGFAQSASFVSSLTDLVAGALYPAVRDKDVLSQRIPLPPLPEQLRIAAKLEAGMAAAARARTAAQARLDAAKQLPTAELATIFASEAARVWPKRPLRELFEFAQYGSSEKSTLDVTGVPVLRMGNIQDGELDWHDLKYMRRFSPEVEKYRLRSGDLVFNRTNSAELVGKTAVFDGSREAVFASYLIRFRMKAEADPHFVSLYINSPHGRRFVADNMGRAIGQVNISASTMERLQVPMPPLDEQRQLVDRYRVIKSRGTKLIEHAAAELAAVEALPAALLREVFRAGVDGALTGDILPSG